MQCPRCQHRNPPQAKFCLECGARFAGCCAQCGTQLPSGAKFCLECGKPTDRHGTEPARFAAPQSYTPKHLAEKILNSKAALEGERKQVTVLFADLKGSMELLADRDPEEARKLLDPVLERMIEAVHRYEGTVNQVMGDGIMALFGAPVAHEDHAVRACYAALRMQESVRRYAEGVRREHGLTIRIRVGLNSGGVVVRAIGSDLHMDYTAVGQTTHLAARLEQLADPGSILLAPDTLAAAEGFIGVTALGPMALKGLPTPVEVYELVGVSAVRSRLQAAAARGLSRFVGRDAEITQLRRALEQARHGRGQVAAVVGEPGVGKSRLLFELTHSHRVDDWLVFEADSVSYGKATSYLPLIDLLKGYFRIGDRDTSRDIREKVTGKIMTLDRGLEPALPALLSLLDVPVEDPPWTALDPAQRRGRTLEAVKRMLLREAQAQPILVVFEDLHWIDSETQALPDGLIESLPTARVLLLVSYRPEYSHGWGQKTYYTQLRLDPLPPETTGELLDALLGGDPSLPPLKRRLAGTTGGNPLFLEESVRALVEHRALVGERGAYRLVQPSETVQVPPTVQAILAARIDRLPLEEKHLLETAAVIGKDFAFSLLEAIADEADSTLRAQLDHLQAAEFLYETSLFPDLEYTFKHALTHEVAYGGLLHERRRVMHGRVLDALERHRSTRLGGQVEQLAHHAVRAEAWERAIPYLRQSGARAMGRSAYGEAARLSEMLVQAVEHQGDAVEASVKLDAYLELFTARLENAEEEETLQGVIARIEELARVGGNDSGLARLRLQQAQAAWSLSDSPDASELAIQRAQQAFDVASPSDLRTRSYAQFLSGSAHRNRGRFRAALREFERGLSLFATADREPETLSTTWPIYVSLSAWGAAEAHAMLGEFDQAIEWGVRGRRVADEIGNAGSRVLAATFQGHVSILKGEPESALRIVEPLVPLAEELGQTHLLVKLLLVLGHASLLLGRADEGLRHLRRALASTKGFMAESTRFGTLSASALMEAGRLDEALAEVATGLSHADKTGADGHRAPRPAGAGDRPTVLARGLATGTRAGNATGGRPLPPRPRQAVPAFG
jgi:class 3 adenylate cyclase/tetratricopeptide (TPR) repeat protein